MVKINRQLACSAFLGVGDVFFFLHYGCVTFIFSIDGVFILFYVLQCN